MLTREAFNALLKTLEEPPAHAIFILATTEAHKLPETIVSRTQRFVFRPIDAAKAWPTYTHRQGGKDQISAMTRWSWSPAHGGGSFRDSISLLDQASSTRQKVERYRCSVLLGIPP